MHSAGVDVVQEGGGVDGDGGGGDSGADVAAAVAPHFSSVSGIWKQHRPLVLLPHSRAGLMMVVVAAVL